MRVLIVTPMHNEAHNIRLLAAQLEDSTLRPSRWVVVDDGSTDGSREALDGFNPSFEFEVVVRSNEGGLIGGSAFKAWQFGLDVVEDIDSYDAVAKLDADVDLGADYLFRVVEALSGSPDVGLVGGVLSDRRDREQNLHVPGPFKVYSAKGYRALDGLPRAVGFDVMDEVALKQAGLQVRVLKDLALVVRRQIGASQGRVHGRRRNGKVCRWVGYWPPYFVLHVVRYAFRRPYGVGALAMVWGYLTAGTSPYPRSLQKAHSAEQRDKLSTAAKNPLKWAAEVYGTRA